MGISEQEFFEANENPSAFIAKNGMDHWLRVMHSGAAAARSLPKGEEQSAERFQRALDTLRESF